MRLVPDHYRMNVAAITDIIEQISKYSDDYERELLDQNISNEYGESSARSYLQHVDSWEALHYFVRFHFHADHLEIYGLPSTLALASIGETERLDPRSPIGRVCKPNPHRL